MLSCAFQERPLSGNGRTNWPNVTTSTLLLISARTSASERCASAFVLNSRTVPMVAATVAHGQQSARIVKYHANDIVNVHAKMHYTTLIQLPATEKILQVATGDKDFWIIDTVGNYCFLHPAKEGIHSNVNLITDKGTVYSFTLDDVESAEPDLKVLSSQVILPPSRRPAAQTNCCRHPKSPLRSSRRRLRSTARHRPSKSTAPTTPTQALKFDYTTRTKCPSVCRRSTTMTSSLTSSPRLRRKFSIYELKDGKPDLIQLPAHRWYLRHPAGGGQGIPRNRQAQAHLRAEGTVGGR